ncbi:MAG TPA: septum formation initiator family protein [Bacteroidota bacterium]|nr:septum formation initiator family protein [Bacteroidota bacterium]
MDELYLRKEKRSYSFRAALARLMRNRRLLLILAVTIPLAVFVVFGNHGILHRIRLQKQKTELEQQLRDAEADQKALEAQSKALDGDPKAIEKVAREQHHMVREGERVYRVDPGK